MADIEFKVKGDAFEPASQNGSPGMKVKFKNKRSSQVTIELDPNFYDQGSLNVPGDGDNHVHIKSTATGTGVFTAPSTDSRKRDGISGDVIINPKR